MLPMALIQRFSNQCSIKLGRPLMTSVPNMRKDKEWKKIENEKKNQYENRLQKLQSSNPFKRNIGLKHQVRNNDNLYLVRIINHNQSSSNVKTLGLEFFQ